MNLISVLELSLIRDVITVSQTEKILQLKIEDPVKACHNALIDDIIEPCQAKELIDIFHDSFDLYNILEWGKYYFPDKFYLPFCSELHDYFISIRNEHKTVTLAPRGHAKTTIKCFLIPIYQALNEPETFKHYLNIQKTSTKAIDINIAIKSELETNEKLIADYELQIGEKWTEKKFVLKNGIIFSALGAGDSIRGLNHKNIRPDYGILDDLYKEDDTNNIDRVNKINKWFWGSVYKCFAIGKPTSIHIQGTAINPDDLMHTLAKSKNWKYKKFQAVKSYSRKTVLWKEGVTYEELMQDKEDMGSIAFERELQNNCRDDETSIIKNAWIQRYEGGRPPEDEKLVAFTGAVDPAVGEKKLNDFTGATQCYITKVDKIYRFYFDAAYNQKHSYETTNRNLKLFYKPFNRPYKGKSLKVQFESNQAFRVFANEFKKKTGVLTILKNANKDKITRLENVSRHFENMNVYFSKNITNKMMDEIIYQLTNNKPNHDDVRDAIVMCLEYTKKLRRIVIAR